MSKEEKNKIVPKLRFPEFKKEGEWEEKKLGQVGTFVGGGTPDTTISEFWGGPIQWFTPTEIKEKYLSKSKRTITEEGLKNSSAKLLPIGTLLLSTRATVGDVGIALNTCTTNQGFQSLIVNDTEVNEFWYYWLVQNRKELLRNSSGSTFAEIGKSEIEKILAFKPQKKEQQKIASCLSTLDDLINAENKKLGLLKDHKKGLMQQIFPLEGEKKPQLRFKEFKNSTPWASEPFSEIYRLISTNSFSRDMLNYDSGRVRNIHYGDIHTKFNTMFDIKKEIVPFVNSDIEIDNYSEDSYCKNSDLIFADASEDMKDVGKSIEIINVNGEKLLAGMHTLHARQRTPKLAVGFAGYLFLSSRIRTQIQREAQGAKVLGISGNRLANIQICYPENKKEQEKIANTLLSLDKNIIAQTEKIERLKAHKKGLLQSLFPNIKEIDA